MSTNRTALVLEGGGLRGAFTAGALAWLLDNNVKFDNAYGISTGAVHLCSYLSGSKDDLYEFSVVGLSDKRYIGTQSLLRTGRIVDYDGLFDLELVQNRGYDIEKVHQTDTATQIGLYDLGEGKTFYTPIQEIGINELKASTTLPILGKTIVSHGREVLDGGITDMIPIEKAVADGCDRCLIITTKPADYVRKPAKDLIVKLMKWTYPQCENISRDYKIRHLNYQRQIEMIKEMVDRGEAVYIYPTQKSQVTRLGGSKQQLSELYDQGYQDMEARKEEIFALLHEKDQ